MKTLRSLFGALLLLAGLTGTPLVAAQTGAYSEEGADTCLGCHDDETAAYSASAIFKTPHGQRGGTRAPFSEGGLQCEACHGPGDQHSNRKRANLINTFKPDSAVPLTQRNQACLSCHEGLSRTGWHAGAHEKANLACTDCHTIHREKDPVMIKASESQVCLSCHTAQRTDFLKTSAHPIRQGRMACSDCHAPHGSASSGMLTKATLNQTCYSCHGDKRGPVLWEHAPVAEDCSLCHDPHGSVRKALLNKSTPLLCQQCHSTAGHPSVARTANGLPTAGAPATSSIFLVGGSCVSCHTQVHGSNHPSGARLMR